MRIALIVWITWLTVLLTGCATSSHLLTEISADLPRRVELTNTPFHAQDAYQCGPAALAMSLGAAGIEVTPEVLRPQVYIPQRKGSLQAEMLAAGRRNGAVSMTIAPVPNALFAEIAAGHPAIVLQNLSLPWAPLWHYAVVIGYDLDREEIVLRSGTTERLVMSLATFLHTWKRGGYWAMLALPPGKLPATAQEETVVEALIAFEKNAQSAYIQSAYIAYETALQRWPHNVTLQLGLGNAAYAAGNRDAAAAAFKKVTQDYPDHVPALNNLATVLAELGELEKARHIAEKAVALGGPWREAANATLQELMRREKDQIK